MALKATNSRGSNGKEFNDVVEQIEDESRARMSDTPSAEDGQIHDEPLLAGYRDENGIIHDTFTYREMTGADEEAINKPDIKSNPGRVMCTLVERCVTQIGSLSKKEVGTVQWGKIIRSMYVGDIEYMMFKIREFSKGKTITFTHKCPHCRTNVETEVETEEFDIMPFNGMHETQFELRKGVKDHHGNYHTTGVVRMMNGYDAEMVLPQFRKNQAAATTLLMSRLMKFDESGDGFMLNTSMVSNMTIHDRDVITGIMNDNKFGVDMKVDIVCPNCGEYLSEEAGVSDFF